MHGVTLDVEAIRRFAVTHGVTSPIEFDLTDEPIPSKRSPSGLANGQWWFDAKANMHRIRIWIGRPPAAVNRTVIHELCHAAFGRDEAYVRHLTRTLSDNIWLLA